MKETSGNVYTNSAVQVFGSLGSANAERNLHRWASRWLPIKPYGLSLPFQSDTGLHTTWEEVYVVLPHEMLWALAKQDQNVFGKCVLGPGGAPGVQAFWERQRQDPWFASVGLAEELLPRTIPIAFREDGVRPFSYTHLKPPPTLLFITCFSPSYFPSNIQCT